MIGRRAVPSWGVVVIRHPGGVRGRRRNSGTGHSHEGSALGPERATRSLETDVNTTEMKRRAEHGRRHAERLAKRSLREAGTRRAVARAVGRPESTVRHETTSRANPELAKALELTIVLNGHPGTSGRPIVEAMLEAVELSDIVTAEDATLVERGLYLLDHEDQLEASENRAARAGASARYADALRSEASVQMELAAIIDELAYRRIDLLELYRAKARA